MSSKQKLQLAVLVGANITAYRKLRGWSQAELAERAGLADRTYSDIERGNANMRVDTLLKICDAMHITPDSVLTEENLSFQVKQEELAEKLSACSEKEKKIALYLLEAYLKATEI